MNCTFTEGMDIQCPFSSWRKIHLRKQILGTLIHLEMLSYQNKQIFIIYWTMVKKITFRIQEAKES